MEISWSGDFELKILRERGVDAVLVLRNENKWAMTGKYFDIFVSQFFGLTFLFDFNFLSVILSACGKRRSSVRTRTRIRKFLLVFLFLW